MARIRSIHPNACTSEKLAAISAEAERCYWRLQTHCDDDGRCEDHPRLLWAALFPLVEGVGPTDVDGWLDELHHAGLVVRYQVDAKRYLEVTNWSEYQHPRRYVPSSLPAAEGGAPAPTPPTVLSEPADTPPARVQPEGRTASDNGTHTARTPRDNGTHTARTPRAHVPPGGGEGEGEGEGGGAGEPSAPGVTSAANGKPAGRSRPLTRAPDSFDVTPDLLAWAHSRGFAGVDVAAETERFLDWHRAKDRRNRDWTAAWRNWMRKAQPPPNGMKLQSEGMVSYDAPPVRYG